MGFTSTGIRTRAPNLRSALWIAVVGAALLVGLTGSSATAGAPERSPASVRLPWAFGPESDGVEATAGHAAGLGFLDGWEMGFGFSLRLDGAGLGDGLFAGGAGRLGPVALGVAVSRIGDGGLVDATTRLDLSAAFRFARWGSLGFRWQRFYGGGGEGLDGYDSLSVSTTLRPARWLSLALGVDQANHPRLNGLRRQPELRAEVGLRPRGDRVTFGLEGTATLDDPTGWAAGATLRIMPIPGLVVGGYGRFVHDAVAPERMEWGVYLGLEQGRGAVSVGLDARSRVSDADVEPQADLSVFFTQGSRVRPSLVTPGRKVVRVSLGGSLPERPMPGLVNAGPPTFGAWLVGLDAMSRDDDVDALVVQLGGAPGWAQCWELRRAFQALRAAHKKVIVHTAGLDMRGMYLASAADRVWLHPVGLLDLRGLTVTRTYLAGLLEKLGVNAQFVKWDDYKSAPERFTEVGPSPQEQEQAKDLLDAFERAWHGAVGAGRGIERPAMDALLADGPQTTTMAYELKLVDRIVDDTQLVDALQEELSGSVRLVDGYDPPPSAWPSWGHPRVIAIIPVVGAIVDGEGTDLNLPFFGISTGDRDVQRAIDQAVADRDVAAIVLRVASPGGSVLASDRIHARLVKAAEKKPLVVSFGDYAASGGYYVALPGHEVLSTPLSITGQHRHLHRKARPERAVRHARPDHLDPAHRPPRRRRRHAPPLDRGGAGARPHAPQDLLRPLRRAGRRRAPHARRDRPGSRAWPRLRRRAGPGAGPRGRGGRPLGGHRARPRPRRPRPARRVDHPLPLVGWPRRPAAPPHAASLWAAASAGSGPAAGSQLRARRHPRLALHPGVHGPRRRPGAAPLHHRNSLIFPRDLRLHDLPRPVQSRRRRPRHRRPRSSARARPRHHPHARLHARRHPGGAPRAAAAVRARAGAPDRAGEHLPPQPAAG
jgi:ClpP class serine protease